jgi:hypothetical protein
MLALGNYLKEELNCWSHDLSAIEELYLLLGRSQQ